MKIKYTYKGSEYIEYIGVDSPDEQLAVLLGSDNSAGILGIAVAITSYSSTDVTVNFTGFNSEGRTQDSNDLALDILNWNFPHIDSDMVEVVPTDAEIVITYLRYETSDGSVISDMTPITIHSCSELRMKNGQEVPSIPNPYPVSLPQPGTGAVGSVPIIPDPDEGGGEGGGGVIADPDYIEYPIWILSYPDWVDPDNYLISEHEYYESLDGALNKLKSRAPIQLAKRTAYYISNRRGATFTGEYLVTVTETASINKSFTSLASLTSESYLDFIKNPSFMQRITINGQFEVPTSDVEPLQWLGDSGYTLELKVYGPNDYADLIANNTVHS